MALIAIEVCSREKGRLYICREILGEGENISEL